MPDTTFQVRNAPGPLMPLRPNQSQLPEHVIPAQPTYQTATAGGHPYRGVMTRIASGAPAYHALLAGPLAEAEAVLADFRTWLRTMIPAILLSACVGGYW